MIDESPSWDGKRRLRGGETSTLAGALAYPLWPLVPAIILSTRLRRLGANALHAIQALVLAALSIVFLVLMSLFSSILSALYTPLGSLFWVALVLVVILQLRVAGAVYASRRRDFPVITALATELFNVRADSADEQSQALQ